MRILLDDIPDVRVKEAFKCAKTRRHYRVMTYKVPDNPDARAVCVKHLLKVARTIGQADGYHWAAHQFRAGKSQRTPFCPPRHKNKTKRNVPLQLRYKVLERDGGKCCLCGSRENLHVDHIVPYSKGGETVLSNLRTLCADCNIGKGALMPKGAA